MFALWGQYFPDFLQGLGVTLELTALALALALLLGFLLALMRLSRIPALEIAATVYTDAIRAVPVLVLLFIAYYSLGAIGFKMSSFTAAVVTLGLFYAALYGEEFRGGIAGVDPGQREAAAALGMPSGTIMRRVVLPQAFFAILPPATNRFADIIKDTSLVVTIGVGDLMLHAYEASSATFLPMDMLGLAAVLYFAIYLVVSRLLARWELNAQRRRS